MEAIKKIILSSTPKEDRLSWVKDQKGLFFVKSAYMLCQEQMTVINPRVKWEDFWKLKVHERFKILVWRIGNNAIPRNLNISSRMGTCDNMCPLCHKESESSVHLFFHCQVAQAIWFVCCWGLHSDWLNVADSNDIVNLVINPLALSQVMRSAYENIQVHTSIQIALTMETI